MKRFALCLTFATMMGCGGAPPLTPTQRETLGLSVDTDPNVDVDADTEDCESDRDGDGTPDCFDDCPDDPNKTRPSGCGCGVADEDRDGDATLDCFDECPDDANKTEPGVCGCGTLDADSDGDEAIDCEDECPNDANKIEAGICGCGSPDVDSDGDGPLDCDEDCPDDPNKIEAGICGCGTPDVDSDDDGTLDCFDECPDDPDKTQLGDCGCGVAETDTDGDGVPDCVDACPDDPGRTLTPANIAFTVSFIDPLAQYTDYYEDIETSLVTASEEWAGHLIAPQSVTIEIEIRFTNEETASAASVASVFVYNNGTYDVYEEGVASEVKTGIDPNGSEPDTIINIGVSFLDFLWFDPDLSSRTAPIPVFLVDAYTVFLHEMGHVLAYNGWRDWTTGTLPGDFESRFDELVIFDGEDFFFTGDSATAVYGGPVPLTFGNIMHLSNRAPRPGSDLVKQLMNGVGTELGTRAFISDIDLAILTDVGLPVGDGHAGCGGNALPQTRSHHPLRLGPQPRMQE
ncbi:MAG: hypothetical protein IID39_05795 [Planctomycetes bacterium]|nr:hypothetical protein [Planctomycetota bacterium]